MKNNTRSILSLLNFFVAFALFVPSAAFSERLYAVLVGDTKGGIEEAVWKDLDRFSHFIDLAGAHTDLEVEKVIFAGNAFKKDLLVSFLSKLKLEEDDLFFFYYSGHGYRGYCQDSLWPNLFFSFTEKGLGSRKLFALFEQIGAGRQIVLLDTCNGYFPFFTDNKLEKRPYYIPEHPLIYQRLFSEFKGKMTLVSSKIGELAMTVTSGSLFTTAFFDALIEEQHNIHLSWEGLFDRAGNLASKRNPDQTAFYKIEN